jgi:hypothetical protein
MRRWFAILILTLLPFQFSWAAVAAYCGHENSQRAQDVGQHAHQHAGQPGAEAAAAAADQNAPAVFDVDCGHCHGCCVSMPALAGDMAALTLASHPAPPAAAALRTLAQSPPERPQWLPLA